MVITSEQEQKLAKLEAFADELNHYKQLNIITDEQYERDMKYVKGEITKIKAELGILVEDLKK